MCIRDSITGAGSVQMQAAGQVRGNFPGLIISAPVTAASNVTVGTNLTITGGGSMLTLNGHTVTVSGNLAVQGAGLLDMTNVSDVLTIGGGVAFDGANETTHLTAGILTIVGNFTQAATSSGASFHPSGSHLTVLSGGSPTIAFATAGDVANTSYFQNLQWSGGGSLTLSSNVFVLGSFQLAGGSILKSQPATPTLTVGSLANASSLTLNNVLLRINQPAGTAIGLNAVTFASTPGNLVALTVDHPGVGSPFTFSNLTFNTVPSTGKYLVANDLNPSDGQPLTINLSNPSPGVPGSFVTATGGAVVNWPSGGAGITWTGAVSNDWFVAGNWSGGSVPNNVQHAIIPSGTPNQPVVLTSFPNIGSLTLDGFLDIAGFDLTVFGDVDGTGSMVNSGGTANLVMSGVGNLGLANLPSLRSNGAMVTLTGNIIVAGDVAVAGNGGLDIGSHNLVAGGNFSVLGIGATLVMTSPTGILNVAGTVTFDGASEVGKLTNGVLAAGGDFTVLSSFTPTAFQATGLHETIFSNALGPQNIQMVNASLTGNHFGHVALNTPGSFTLVGMPLFVEGSFNSPGTGSVVHGNGFRVQASWSDINGLTLDNAPLQIINPAVPPALIINDVLFQNMSSAVDQLSISLPGAPTAYSLNNLVFGTTPVNGSYIFASDNLADANILTLNIVNPTPSSPGAFAKTAGGAVIIWPGTAPAPIWTGANSILWNDPGNWSTNQVPNSSSDVTIPNGTPNQPTLDGVGADVHNLQIQSGATVNNPDLTFVVNGDLTGAGFIVGLGPTMTGSAVTWSLNQVDDLTITGSVTLGASNFVNNSLTITGLTAQLDIGANTLNVGGDLTVDAGGLLKMISSSATVLVNGNALFDGGNETGLLTNGNLNVRGNFTQANSVSKSSFAASGNHTLVLDGTSPQTVTMPDSLLSHAGNLFITNTTGITVTDVVSVLSALTIAANVPVTSTDLSFTGGGFNVLGSVFTGAGSLLKTGRLYVGTTLTVNGTWNQTSVIFTGTGQTAPSTIPYNFFYSKGTVTMAPGAFNATTLTVQGGSLTLSGKTTIGGGGVFLTAGTLKPNSNTLTTSGSLNLSATGTLTMQNALDSVITTGTGSAFFGGGSTAGLLTAGVLKIAGNFVQTAGTSNTSFAASGTHKTLLGAPGIKIINFATPGTGAGGSHFGNLDVTAATGGLNLSNDIVADGALISLPAGSAPTISGTSKKITAMSLTVTAAGTSLVLNYAPLVVNEQGTIRPQQFDRVSFLGYSAGATLMDMTMVGTSVTPRPITFNGLALQTSGAGLYAKLVSSNSQFVTVTINGSDDPTGGPSKSNPSFGSTVNGARIVWQ